MGGEVSLLTAPPCPTIYIILWVSVRDFDLCFPEDVSVFGVLWIRAPTALGKHPQFCCSTPMFQIRKATFSFAATSPEAAAAALGMSQSAPLHRKKGRLQSCVEANPLSPKRQQIQG